jgi:hypothetical protein
MSSSEEASIFAKFAVSMACSDDSAMLESGRGGSGGLFRGVGEFEEPVNEIRGGVGVAYLDY